MKLYWRLQTFCCHEHQCARASVSFAAPGWVRIGKRVHIALKYSQLINWHYDYSTESIAQTLNSSSLNKEYNSVLFVARLFPNPCEFIFI